tara:strand:- start:48 stop:1076 length:1029 start_codon:yes stop_codon:yes gene_type:complete
MVKKVDPFDAELEKLKENGSWFWTSSIRSTGSNNALSDLIKTRDQFMKILETETEDSIVNALLKTKESLTEKLVITHLMRATDGSAELLDRVKDYLSFKKIKSLTIQKNDGTDRTYKIQSMGTTFTTKLRNKEILAGNKKLHEDIITILLFGSKIKEFTEFITFKKLNLGQIIGDQKELGKYFESLYIKVSRQESGIATAASGTGPQKVVDDALEKYFSKNNSINRVSTSRIKGIGKDKEGQQFDTVYQVDRKGESAIFVAIEIAFQETTNSVIERKSKQAVELFKVFKQNGYFLCFVIDGAGYFSRKKATKDIIKNSHQCVTFNKSDLQKLCEFIENLSST